MSREVFPDWLTLVTRTSGVAPSLPPNKRDFQVQLARPSGEDPEFCYYDPDYAHWLSFSRYQMEGAQYGAYSTAGGGLFRDYANAALWRYGANIGWVAPYDVQLMSFSAYFAAANTATLQIYSNNVAVAGATVAVAAAQSAQADGFTSVATIPRGNYVGIHLAAGSITVGCVATATFARVLG